jgi:hypothetical protein
LRRRSRPRTRGADQPIVIAGCDQAHQRGLILVRIHAGNTGEIDLDDRTGGKLAQRRSAGQSPDGCDGRIAGTEQGSQTGCETECRIRERERPLADALQRAQRRRAALARVHERDLCSRRHERRAVAIADDPGALSA